MTRWDDTLVVMRSAGHASLESYLEALGPVHDEAAFYLEQGEWHEGPQREPPAHVRTGDNRCYHNAQTSMGVGLEYAEGYAWREGEGAIPHAWLVDEEGLVVETCPSLLELGCRYYGISPGNGFVRTCMLDRETAEPVVERLVGGGRP